MEEPDPTPSMARLLSTCDGAELTVGDTVDGILVGVFVGIMVESTGAMVGAYVVFMVGAYVAFVIMVGA